MPVHLVVEVIASVLFGLASLNVPCRRVSLGWLGAFVATLLWYL